MFDYLKINVSQLPVYGGDYKKLVDAEFQTKSLDKAFMTYEITEDNRLRYWCNKEWIYEEFHGYIVFYTSVENEWFDFKAKFTDGICVNIERVFD